MGRRSRRSGTGYSLTITPLIVDNFVIVGSSGAEYGIRGFVKAYNKDDGKPAWTFYTLPDKGWEGNFAEKTGEGEDLKRDIAAEKAAMAQYGDAWKRGGGSVWMTPAYDPISHNIFFSVGNPSPDLDGTVRPGDNLYTESIVAIDARTGEYKWHYQQVPHDVWDFDATSPPVIIKLKNGKTAVAEAAKTAFVYVLDAETGKLIRKSEEFNRHENYFVQPTADGVRMLPGANGGSEWSPPAVNPTLGYMYVLGLEQPMNYITHSAGYEKGKLWLGSAFKAVPGEKQYGTFTAIDLNTGKRAWQVKTDQPMIGGALATAGNLVFTGEGNGHFNAYDARSGKDALVVHCRRRLQRTASVVLGRWQAVHCGRVRRKLSARISVGRRGAGVRAAWQCGSHEESEVVATRRMEAVLPGVLFVEEMVGSLACEDVGNAGSRDRIVEWCDPGKVVAVTVAAGWT